MIVHEIERQEGFYKSDSSKYQGVGENDPQSGSVPGNGGHMKCGKAPVDGSHVPNRLCMDTGEDGKHRHQKDGRERRRKRSGELGKQVDDVYRQASAN